MCGAWLLTGVGDPFVGVADPYVGVAGGLWSGRGFGCGSGRWYNRLLAEVVEEVLELVVFVEVIGQMHVHCRRMVDWSRW
jgi:hypothetical protein